MLWQYVQVNWWFIIESVVVPCYAVRTNIGTSCYNWSKLIIKDKSPGNLEWKEKKKKLNTALLYSRNTLWKCERLKPYQVINPQESFFFRYFFFSPQNILTGLRPMIALIVMIYVCQEWTRSISFICTTQKMKFSIKDSFSKCNQIRKKLRIWSHLLKKSLLENFIFCAVLGKGGCV